MSGLWHRFTTYAHIEIRDDDDDLVAVIGDGSGGSSPSRVTSERARLIAAAPELFAELERQIEWAYNPFEPDNQSAGYYRMVALRDKILGNSVQRHQPTRKQP